jgi:putative intracellular protease/amidase
MTVLFVLSSHDQFGQTGRRTGTWLEELLRPYYYLVDHGMTVEFTSPNGGAAPIDPLSIEALKSDPIFERYSSDGALQAALERTRLLSQVRLEAYAALIYPGGHGPLWDLRGDKDSIAAIERFAGEGKPVGTICHAGCVLLGVKSATGKPLVSGRELTAFSDSEERAVGFDKDVPYVVERELASLGARYRKAADWQEHVVVDGRLVTGQNPASALGVAKAIFKMLQAR